MIGVRIEEELVTADLSGASLSAVVQALQRVPGARDVASRVVSTALIDGMGQTWDENEDLVRVWEYTAVLDRATCDRCRPLDGKRYDSWKAAQEDLPGGGPNPRCRGGGRCRCRLVPADTGEVGQNAPEEPPVEPVIDEPAHVAAARKGREAVRSLDPLGENYQELVDRVGLEEANRIKAEFGERWKATNARGEVVPAAGIREIERAVIEAGGVLDDELARRTAALAPELDVKIGQAKVASEEFLRTADAAASARTRIRTEIQNQIRPLREQMARALGIPDPGEAYATIRLKDHPRLNEYVELVQSLSPRYTAAQDAYRAAAEPYQAMLREIESLQSERFLVERRALRETLEEIRPIGGGEGQRWRYSTAGTRGKAKELAEAGGDYFPDDWRKRAAKLPIDAKYRSGARAWARSDGRILFSAGDRSKVVTDLDGLATAIHELAHHVEHADARVRLLEWAFYQRRVRPGGLLDEPMEALRPLPWSRREKYREDGFGENYIGKDYGSGPSSNYELLSMGLEALWTGSYELDAEMRRFILGLLATL